MRGEHSDLDGKVEGAVVWMDGAHNLDLQDERHSYEKCQYVEFKKRVAKMDELRAAKGGERSN